MLKISDGQCGLCAHFGEDHASDQELVQIRIRGEAPEGLTDECGHPQHAGLHLHVSPNSGCEGFLPAKAG